MHDLFEGSPGSARFIKSLPMTVKQPQKVPQKIGYLQKPNAAYELRDSMWLLVCLLKTSNWDVAGSKLGTDKIFHHDKNNKTVKV